MNDNRIIDLDFGADGALYVGRLLRVELRDQQRQHRRAALRLHRRRGHSGSRPAGRRRPRTRATFAFNIGKSGGVSYKWDFSDGGTATGANVTHTYSNGGNGSTATLTVTYADGTTASKTIDVAVPTTVPAHGHR